MKRGFGNIVLPILDVALCVVVASRPANACVPPKIKILSPTNTIYATSSVPLIFTVDKATSWMGHVLDGQTNITITGNTTLTALEDGAHHVIVYANGTDGIMGASYKVYFSVDTTPPNIKDIMQFPLAIMCSQTMRSRSTPQSPMK